MREQTIVVHAAEGSRMIGKIAEMTQTVLFEGVAFVLGLGIAYLAVCYGIEIPAPEIVKESNP